MIAWGDGNLAHWAIFVPNRAGSPIGRIFHFGVEAQSSGMACMTTPQLLCHPFHVRRSGASHCFEIHAARVTIPQVEEAASTVFRTYTYNIVTANCQNFAMDVLL